jgi:hypothetical protein
LLYTPAAVPSLDHQFLWSPFVDLLKTKRWWIVTMQLLIGASLAGVAFSLPTPHWFQYSMAFFWLMAFSSATHDIAPMVFTCWGSTTRPAFFVGIRNTFYRLAMIVVKTADHPGRFAGDHRPSKMAECQSDNALIQFIYPLVERMGTIPLPGWSPSC